MRVRRRVSCSRIKPAQQKGPDACYCCYEGEGTDSILYSPGWEPGPANERGSPVCAGKGKPQFQTPQSLPIKVTPEPACSCKTQDRPGTFAGDAHQGK